jgi:hypothetical protein
VIAFLLTHWKLILPAALIAGLAADDAWHRIALANLKASQAQELAAAEAAVRKALQADQEASNALVARYAAEIAALQGSLADALVAQAKAQPTPLAISLLLPALSIAACSSSTPPRLVNRVPPAELAQPCPRAPPLPGIFLDEQERYSWILRALAAGNQCRDQSDAQTKWMVNPPK